MRAKAGRLLPALISLSSFPVHALIFTKSTPAESFLALASHGHRSSPLSFCPASGGPRDSHAVPDPVHGALPSRLRSASVQDVAAMARTAR